MKCKFDEAEMRIVGEEFTYGDSNAEMTRQSFWCPACGSLAHVSPRAEDEDLRRCFPYAPANTVVTWDSPGSP